MKWSLLFCFIAALSAITPALASHDQVSISADQVISASDIEQAINEATGYGTHPGTVILDARAGPFIYSAPDRSINIFYSDVNLRSLNGAVITNCVDGILFDNVSASDVIIEGITFQCESNGIVAGFGTHDRVTIQNNVIEAAGIGIGANGGRGWLISNNEVVSGVDAINLIDTTKSMITGNLLSGNEIALFLDQANRNKVTNNHLSASWQGILLIAGTNSNKVNGNRIFGPRNAGISLEGNNENNKIHGNRVTCAPEFQCLAVSGPAEVFETNKISGNKVR